MLEPYGKPLVWIFDSARSPLGEALPAFDRLPAVFRHFGAGEAPRAGAEPPDVVFFSAGIEGGAGGAAFMSLRAAAGGVPLIAVSRLRSFAQALSFFRNGVFDYISLPVDDSELSERFEAALAKKNADMSTVMVEFEAMDEAARDGLTLTVHRAVATEVEPDEDILAQLATGGDTPPKPDGAGGVSAPAGADTPREEADADPVDGLPIPSLWDELPCGLLAFDSRGNLVFANSMAMKLFGHLSLNSLREALENGRPAFNALGANRKPLPDNQWPHLTAVKAKAARANIVSIARPDHSRLWLRMDCLPHLSDGKVNRMSMTVINMTGELPSS